MDPQGIVHKIHLKGIHMVCMKAPATTRDIFEPICFKVEAHATSTAGSFFLLNNGMCCFAGFVLSQFVEKNFENGVLLWIWMCSMVYEGLINVLFVWWPGFEDVWNMFGYLWNLSIRSRRIWALLQCFNYRVIPPSYGNLFQMSSQKKCHGVFQPLEKCWDRRWIHR